MVNYKLTYFNGRGRAESIRQLFHAAGIPFEDNRIDGAEWAALKPKSPFGTIPLLDVDGQLIAQTCSILRFLGRQFGMAGKTPVEQALVEGFIDQGSDLFAEIGPYFFVVKGFKQGDAAELKKTVFDPVTQKHLATLKKFFRPDSFLVGDSLTIADIFIANLCSELKVMDPTVLKNYPEIEKFIEKVYSNPRLQKWLKTRPETPF